MSLNNLLPSSLLVLLLFSCPFILAIPAWEGMTGRSSIGSLVTGISNIQAMGPVTTGGVTKHLTVHSPGQISNLTVGPVTNMAPPHFYIKQEQLWLLVNETAVYPVNVHNSTGTHALPMQLVLGKKREGITTGSWRWKSTMLYYDLPNGKSNDGLYFRCMTDSGAYNMFMTFTPARAPDGCQHVTLHSFNRSDK